MHAWLLRLCGLLLLCCAGTLAAQQTPTSNPAEQSLELSLSNSAYELRYNQPANFGVSGSEYTAAAFLSQERDFVLSGALLFGTDLNLWGLHAQFGPQAYAAWLNEATAPSTTNDVFALAIGAHARYDFIPSQRLAVAGYAFWSPNVLTFGAAHNLTDFMVRGEIGIADRLVGFVGYRWFEFKVTGGPTRRLQNEVFAGVNWRLH